MKTILVDIDIKSKLMPLEEYSKTRWPDIYTFNIKTHDGRELYYFGVTHYRDPKNPIFEQIKTEFDKFKPDIVFIEGANELRNERRDIIIEKFKRLQGDDLIYQTGESGFTAKLALEKGIYLDSPEPKFEDEIKMDLDNGFSKDEIFLYHMARYVRQLQRIPEPRPSPEEFSLPKSTSLKIQTGWSDFDFSFEHFNNLAIQMWGEDYDLSSGSLLHPSPQGNVTVINKISRNTVEFRNEYMVGEIIKVLQQYKRLFVVYGFSHAVIQEPALRALLK